jgi:DNA-binding MarR family transcriptional regulator
MGIFQDSGLLIIGTRLKRLSERFLSEVSKVYKNQNIRFEPVWFPILFLLDKKGAMSLTEIAAELDVSHSAISQMITQLQTKKIVEILPDSSDARLKRMVFTSKGKKLIEQVHPVWQALSKSLDQVLPANLNPQDFLNTLSSIEDKLAANFLSETTLQYLNDQSPDVIVVEPDLVLQEKLLLWTKLEAIPYEPNNDSLIISMHKKSIVGFTSCQVQEGSVLLTYLYVNSSQRRKGIAMQMLKYLFEKHLNNSENCFLLNEGNLDLIRVLIKSGYSFKVK